MEKIQRFTAISFTSKSLFNNSEGFDSKSFVIIIFVLIIFLQTNFFNFVYLLYSLSSSCYEVLRSVLPFPCQSVLRTHFSSHVAAIEKRLITEDSIETTLKLREKDFDEEIIYNTLAVDAFTVSNLMPK